MAAALFALNWAILLLYYLPGPPQDELLSTFSGILLVYVGVLLIREARSQRPAQRAGPVAWIDTLPLILFRITVGGYGTYLIARRLVRAEYGYSTLALAFWGTVLTLFGYFTIWLGVCLFYQGSRSARRVALALGLLLGLYSACEVGHCAWYATRFWPPYHRYLRLETARGAPEFQRLRPLRPQRDWPDYDRWQRLTRRSDWPRVQQLVEMKAEPRQPHAWKWLTYSFSALKVVLTIAILALLWRRPRTTRAARSSSVAGWLDRHLQPDSRGSANDCVEAVAGGRKAICGALPATSAGAPLIEDR